MNKIRFLYLLFAIVLLGLCPACVWKDSAPKTLPLVGVWMEKSEFYSRRAITLRQSDGSFKQVVGRGPKVGQPEEIFAISGLWWIKPKTYVFEVVKSSVLDSKIINKKIPLEIISISGDTFRYWSTDGAQVTETKVAEDSLGSFDIEVEKMFGKNSIHHF
jgi:hypothetical protein